MTTHPRPIHCSFCLEEGHHINRCKDASISLLNEDVEEVAAIDWRVGLNQGLLVRKLLTLTAPELKVLCYKYAIPSINTRSNLDIIEELVVKFTENPNTHRFVIESLNATEIDYFAEKVYLYLLSTDPDETMTLNEIRDKLSGNTPTEIKNNEITISPMNTLPVYDKELVYYVEFLKPVIDSLKLNDISRGIYLLQYPFYACILISAACVFYQTTLSQC